MADYVEDGQSWDEIVALATEVEAAGATIINTGIGWHEARVPTIVTSVPNARRFVDISNAMAEHVRHSGGRVQPDQHAAGRRADPRRGPRPADLDGAAAAVADPDWVRKARGRRRRRDQHVHRLQPGLPDHAFKHKTVSCLLNPRAGHETTLVLAPTRRAKRGRRGRRGTGRAGRPRSAAAQRGHPVTLFEAGATIGGQFDLARRIPGKEEFSETIRYYTRDARQARRRRCGCGTRATVDELAGFDEVVLATGVAPRMPDIPGIDHPMVLSYAEAITGKPVGKPVAVDRRGRHRLRRRASSW